MVTLNGVDHYLGRYGSPESKVEYDRVTAEWLALGRRLPGRPDGMLVKELICGYHAHLVSTLPSFEDRHRLALKADRELYGESRVDTFGVIAFGNERLKLTHFGAI